MRPLLYQCHGQSISLNNSLFHKTVPKSSLKMHWYSVRFYEMGDMSNYTRLHITKRKETQIFLVFYSGQITMKQSRTYKKGFISLQKVYFHQMAKIPKGKPFLLTIFVYRFISIKGEHKPAKILMYRPFTEIQFIC